MSRMGEQWKLIFVLICQCQSSNSKKKMCQELDDDGVKGDKVDNSVGGDHTR